MCIRDRIYDIQKDIIGTQKETFEKNLNIEASRGLAEIGKVTDLLQKDEEIIALRTKITKAVRTDRDTFPDIEFKICIIGAP